MVSCDVFEACLDDKPNFETLSYTWDQDPQWSMAKLDVVEDTKKEERPILCNGMTRHITMNLYHALTELRRQKLQVPIWADQICIHQEDVNEKASQLAIMADIFRSASRVTVWLGKLTTLKSQALNVMKELPDEPTGVAPTLPTSETGVKTETIKRSLSGISSFTSSLNEHYHRFIIIFVISCRWFRRAWTLQEFMLATEFRLVMGHREISPNSIIKATLQTLQFYSTDYLSQRYGLDVVIHSLHKLLLARAKVFSERVEFQNGKRYSAEEYLGVIRTRRAAKMKDKVFAGAALLEAGVPSIIDYHSTTLDVYTTYTLERLWPETRIFTLSLVGGTISDVEGLPSWMPDLNKYLRPQPLRYCGCPTFETPLFAENNATIADGKTLQTKAAEWDTVESVGESNWSWGSYGEAPYNSGTDSKMRTSESAPAERFGMMFALLDKLGAVYAATGERTIDAFWQTLIGGANLKSKDDRETWRDRFKQWFAFTLVSIRSCLHDEKKKTGMLRSSPDKWMVPLVADAERLEQRVSAFLNVHDPDTGDPDTDASDVQLRKTISHIMRRLLGAEQLEGSGSWTISVAQMLSNIRHEDFYNPVSIFGQLFDAVYDGRRIFLTKSGYLGTAPEGVTAGDKIFLIAGADIPYVLRPMTTKAHAFSLVGEAYVHGIMEGGDQLAAELDVVSISIV